MFSIVFTDKKQGVPDPSPTLLIAAQLLKALTMEPKPGILKLSLGNFSSARNAEYWNSSHFHIKPLPGLVSPGAS